MASSEGATPWFASIALPPGAMATDGSSQVMSPNTLENATVVADNSVPAEDQVQGLPQRLGPMAPTSTIASSLVESHREIGSTFASVRAPAAKRRHHDEKEIRDLWMADFLPQLLRGALDLVHPFYLFRDQVPLLSILRRLRTSTTTTWPLLAAGHQDHRSLRSLRTT